MAATAESLGLVALGGLGEIGMNCLALEVDGRVLIVDCGVMFSSDNIGVDLIHPSFDYLTERRDDIEGVVLTHAHEDHISGVPFLLREMDVPVYGGSYALGLLEEKMSSSSEPLRMVSRTIGAEQPTRIGPFTVTPFPMPHSIVQNTGLLIETERWRVLHTGDFKLGDPERPQGRSALERLGKIGGGGVDLMLSDSTGIEEREISGDDQSVIAELERIIGEASGRVYVALFSSNVRRLVAVVKAASRLGRKVALSGRSVLTHTRVAEAAEGIAPPRETIVSIEEASELPRERSVIIVSGTQGEPRSALGRLAEGHHRQLAIEPGDVVVLSSRFIPGNEIAIGRVIDCLARLGAQVVHRGVNPEVHVSGHASRYEIEAAIEAVRPRAFVPIHGTFRHLIAAAGLAEQCGVDETAVLGNGDCLTLEDGRLRVSRNRVRTRRVCVDGGSRVPEAAIKDRRLLAAHGVMVVTLTLDREGVPGSIDIIARGVTREEVLPWLSREVNEKVREIVRHLDQPDRRVPERVGEAVRSGMRRYLSRLISREPYVLVSVLSV